MEILKLTERIEIALEISESYYREFKSAFEGAPGKKQPRELKEIKYDIAKTLVAFANADGGEMFVGIEDNNTVTGVPHSPNDLEEILNSYKDCIMKDTPVPLKQATMVDFKGQKVIYFSVSKGSEFVHLTAKGECYQRRDRESVPTASEKIVFERNERISREYDREFIELAKVTDLDQDLIQSVGHKISKVISAERLLQYFDLAEFDGETFKLRKAALLLFAKKSMKWHPRNQVRIFKVRGVEEKTGKDFNVTEIGEANGNIFELIEGSWDLLRPHLTDTKFSDDALFKKQIMYPEFACREALINAITHRDYSSEGRGIEVKIFDNKLTIENPGELLSSISLKDIESLSGAHQSRNTYIARVLRETGYVRELGEGIRRIYSLMKSNDMVAPTLKSANNTFGITLYYKHVYSKEEQLWLENFKGFDLSREQSTVIRLGINSRLISAKAIFEAVGIVDEKAYRELIESLRKIGLLETTLNGDEVTNQKRKYGGLRKAVPRYTILVPKGKDAPPQKDDEDRSEYARIYVGNVPYNLTEDDLKNALGKFGEIVDMIIPRWQKTNQCKGFCFIEYDKRIQANNALNSVDPIFINGRKLYLREADKIK